jgi:hypothetical protein
VADAEQPATGVLGRGGTSVLTVGLAVFLAGGILTALLAARLLSPTDYTVFTAFSSLVGIVVLGPSGALEQESALHFSRDHASEGHILRGMLARAAVVWFLVSLVVLVPLGGWQHRLLGASTGLAVALVVAGSPFVWAAAVGRGHQTARRALRVVGTANAATGLAMLALPLVGRALGLSWLSAFLAGAVVAWLPALVLVAVGFLRTRPAAAATDVDEATGPPVVTAWLLAGNLAMLATLLIVPVVLRWHVETLGAQRVAQAQLLVSLSRLSSTVMLGLLVVMVAQLSASEGRGQRLRRWLALSVVLGGGAVLGLAVVGAPIVALLTGDDVHLSTTTNVLATAPAAVLCPAVVAMAYAIVLHRWWVVVLAWAAALLSLVVVMLGTTGATLTQLLVLIAVACTLPVLVLGAGLGSALRPRPVAHGG